MARDRFATRAAIIESAAEIVAAKGVGALGVNGLADAAHCDKVLIYRYFGGLDGVLDALGAERMLWPAAQLEDSDGDGNASLADAVCTMLLEEWAALAGGALMLGASAAEVIGANSLGTATATQRAERHTAMVLALRDQYRVPPYVDLPALVEILSASLSLFALRAAHANGSARGELGPQAFDLNTPARWRRIEKTMAALTRALLDVE
ncbi:MAG TPA: TetR/AcrR family transcriptional regulator [Gemmatimonadaceae bacterium]|nr:TetR/AcrR family transcriptional regulator [Gemmatimonadaceae bacterium]